MGLFRHCLSAIVEASGCGVLPRDNVYNIPNPAIIGSTESMQDATRSEVVLARNPLFGR